MKKQDIDTLNLLDDTPEHLLTCTPSAKYDVIGFEFYIFDDSFELPRDIDGYEYKKHFIVPGEGRFNPDWSVDKYKNLKTGNPIYIAISTRFMKDAEVFFKGRSRKVKRPHYLVRTYFHGEKTALTAKEIDNFLDIVVKQYRKFLASLKHSELEDERIVYLPRPHLFVAEVAVDFRGPCVYYLHSDFGNSLYRKRARKYKKYADEKIDNETGETIVIKESKGKDPKYTHGDRVLYKHLSTSYISDSYRDYFFDVIKRKSKKKDREVIEVFRFEMILRKRYLMSKGIRTVADLEQIDWVKYWTDNFMFYKFDMKKIGAYLEKFPAFKKTVGFIIELNDTAHQSEILRRLKELAIKVKGKKKEEKLFGYPSRQLITSKWHRLDLMIQDALRTLSLSGRPANRAIRIRPRDLKRVKPDGRKDRKMKAVFDAIASLKEKGIKSSTLSIRAFAKEAGISKKTAQEERYKVVWQNDGAIPPTYNNYINGREK